MGEIDDTKSVITLKVACPECRAVLSAMGPHSRFITRLKVHNGYGAYPCAAASGFFGLTGETVEFDGGEHFRRFRDAGPDGPTGYEPFDEDAPRLELEDYVKVCPLSDLVRIYSGNARSIEICDAAVTAGHGMKIQEMKEISKNYEMLQSEVKKRLGAPPSFSVNLGELRLADKVTGQHASWRLQEISFSSPFYTPGPVYLLRPF